MTTTTTTLARRRAPVTPVPARADDRAPPERWQHGQAEAAPVAPRMPTTVASGVQSLRDAKVIDNSEVAAANRFRDDYIRGIEGVREPTLAMRSGSADAHDVAIARAMAVGRHREIAGWLGSRMTGWLVAFLVEDLTFVAMAERYWPGEAGRKEMRGSMMTMLVLLSHLYAALDRRRKRRPSE